MVETLHANELIKEGYKAHTPREILRKELLRKIQDFKDDESSHESIFQSLYPKTILEPEYLEKITSSIISRGNHLVLGPPGSGKTNLIKDIWKLIPKNTFAVADCPVHEDPMSIVSQSFSARVPPCPFCRAEYFKESNSKTGKNSDFIIEPSAIPVVPITLREGYGMARVQGSPEVFPDNLTGTINLHKLEKIGDPTSPLVLQPGKLIQANRGMLIIDEIGKLTRGTQNVLLQALQEHTVTPAKSRESFPASFVAVSTTNLDDLVNINEPLNDRLNNIYIDFSQDSEKNRRIIDLAFQDTVLDIYLPTLFINANIKLISLWREQFCSVHELVEIGSNRSLIDCLKRTEAYSLQRGCGTPSVDDFKEGMFDTMLARIRARSGDSFLRSKEKVQHFLDTHFEKVLQEEAKKIWCGYFQDVLHKDKSEGIRTVQEIRNTLKETKTFDDNLLDSNRYRKLKRFSDYLLPKETYRGNYQDSQIFQRSFGLLEQFQVFTEV